MTVGDAKALFDAGDSGGALAALEGLREDAVARKDQALLEEVRSAAAELEARTQGREAKKLGRLSALAHQNLNFLQVQHGVASPRDGVASTATPPLQPEPSFTARPDIETALGRMSTRFGGRREIKKLAEYIWEDETVSRMATGTFAAKNGLLVLTDRRLIFIYHGWTSTHNEDFPLDALTSISSGSGLVLAKITAFAGGARHEIHNVNKTDAKAIVDEVRQRIATRGARAVPVPQVPPVPHPAAQPAPQQDVLGQIRQLGELRDAGILTEEEFEAKKAELLARL